MSDEGLIPPNSMRLSWSDEDPTLVQGPTPSVDDKVCFSCLRPFTQVEESEEHLFARWLLSRFDLYGRHLNLPNRTQIRFNKLKVNACEGCNNHFLGTLLENPVARATLSREAAESLDRNVLGSWCAKLYYSLYLKGAFLKFDRADPVSRPLVDPRFVQSVDDLRLYVMTAAPHFSIAAGEHSSVFTLGCEVTPGDEFDYRDLPWGFRPDPEGGAHIVEPLNCIAVRIGPVGVIACLGDGGIVRNEYGDEFTRTFRGRELNETEFYAAAASLFAARAHLDWVPRPLVFETSANEYVCVINTTTASAAPLFRPAEEFLTLSVFSEVVQVPMEALSYEDDQVHISGD